MTKDLSIFSKPYNNTFSASSLSSLETCETKFHYEYIRGLESTSLSNGLKTGLMMHDAQEMYLHCHNSGAVIDSVEQEARSRGWDEDELFIPKLRAYIKGYYNAWETEDAERFNFFGEHEVIDVEKPFEFKYTYKKTDSEVNFIGKMDAVIHDKKNDRILLMEHKNVSSRDCQDPTSLFWQSLIMNSQLTIYVSYLEQKYNKPVFVWYDVVLTSPATKPRIVNRKTKERESIEDFEERVTNLYMDPDENKYIRKLMPIPKMARERRLEELARLADRAGVIAQWEDPLRNTQSCRNYGGCQFFQACIGAEKAEESNRFQIKEHFKKKDTDDYPF